MYFDSRNIVFGFHGCDRSVRDEIVLLNRKMKLSENKYDWLGCGAYFWEGDFTRAYEWACESKKIKEPAVLGAFIDLGNCLDLINSKYIKLIRPAYDHLVEAYRISGEKMPQNTTDLLRRDLDCQVISTICQLNKNEIDKDFDTVRAAFWEGKDIYEKAGFKEKNHIQICVRNIDCIKGFFVPEF